MIIQGIPSGNKNGASPRLRYFRRKMFMPEDIVWNDYSAPLNCDVLYVQKRANLIDLIKEARSTDVPVVYDSDDGDGVRRKGDDTPIFPLVDVITTDSWQRAEKFRKITDTRVVVVPDGIDYLEACPKPVKIRGTIKKVCTFGSFRSVRATVDYVVSLKKSYQIAYITKKKINGLKKCNFKKWRFNTLVSEIQKCDVCILAHENTDEKQCKGNARLLVAMAVGIPAIVSDTPSYVETMKACGMDRFVVGSNNEVPDKMQLLSDKGTRQEIQKVFMEYAWANHHPRISALELANIFREVYHAKHPNIQQ